MTHLKSRFQRLYDRRQWLDLLDLSKTLQESVSDADSCGYIACAARHLNKLSLMYEWSKKGIAFDPIHLPCLDHYLAACILKQSYNEVIKTWRTTASQLTIPQHEPESGHFYQILINVVKAYQKENSTRVVQPEDFFDIQAFDAESCATAEDTRMLKVIGRNPDDIDSYLVYSDWLQARGDPRGELIALSHRIAQSGGNDPEQKRQKLLYCFQWGRLVSIYHQHFLGTWGFITKARHPVQVRWHLGFISDMALTGSRVYRKKLGDRTVVSLFNEILAHPSCRFLRSLEIEELFFDYEGRSFLSAVKRLAERIEHLPLLYSLKLKTIDVTLDPFPINRTNLVLFSKLKHLSLVGRFSFLVRPQLPKLKSLRIDINGHDGKLFDSFRHNEWSELRSLSFHFQCEDSQQFLASRFLQPIFSGDNLPKLHTLKLNHFPSPRALLAQLTVSKLFPRLENLHLSFEAMADSEAQALVLQKNAFRRLKSFSVQCQYVGEKEAELLHKHIPGIKLIYPGSEL